MTRSSGLTLTLIPLPQHRVARFCSAARPPAVGSSSAPTLNPKPITSAQGCQVLQRGQAPSRGQLQRRHGLLSRRRVRLALTLRQGPAVALCQGAAGVWLGGRDQVLCLRSRENIFASAAVNRLVPMSLCTTTSCACTHSFWCVCGMLHGWWHTDPVRRTVIGQCRTLLSALLASSAATADAAASSAAAGAGGSPAAEPSEGCAQISRGSGASSQTRATQPSALTQDAACQGLGPGWSPSGCGLVV